jgi:6-phosphogluconolactonase
MAVREVIVCSDQHALAHAAAQFVLGDIELVSGRRFLLALSGGSTPALLYDVLAANPANAELLNSRCEFFFSDERAVAADHPDSNFGLAYNRLFEPLGLHSSIIHRMKGESADLVAEAERYAQLVQSKAVARNGVPQLDLTILGMGADGHTASIFPGNNLGESKGDLVIAPWVESLKAHRLSFSMTLVNASRAVLILVSGESKASAVKTALDSAAESAKLPVARVAAERTVWLLDKPAASQLNWTGPVLSL